MGLFCDAHVAGVLFLVQTQAFTLVFWEAAFTLMCTHSTHIHLPLPAVSVARKIKTALKGGQERKSGCTRMGVCHSMNFVGSVAQFLTGCGLLPVHEMRFGDPCYTPRTRRRALQLSSCPLVAFVLPPCMLFIGFEKTWLVVPMCLS